MESLETTKHEHDHMIESICDPGETCHRFKGLYGLTRLNGQLVQLIGEGIESVDEHQVCSLFPFEV